MAQPPNEKKAAESKTGRVPKIDPALLQQEEPPMPPNLPEMDEFGSVTGSFRIKISEGRDKAKDADDSARREESGGESQPKRA
jgi:hypothetical protein